MGKLDYKVNKDQYTVSTTMDNVVEEEKWSLDDVFKSELTPEHLIDTLKVTDALKRKYPNDEIITDFEEVIRNEICMMFGGSIYDEK